MGLGGIHQFQGNFRLNHAFPPFDDPKVRQVMWKLVDQDATLTAIGVPDATAPSRARHSGCAARRYHRCRLMRPRSTSPPPGPSSRPRAQGRPGDHPRGRGLDQPDRLARAGAEHEGRRLHGGAAAARWPTVLARRAKKDGWSMFPVYSNGTDMSRRWRILCCGDLQRLPGLVVRQPRARADEGFHARRYGGGAQEDRGRHPDRRLRDGAVGHVGTLRHPCGLSDRP